MLFNKEGNGGEELRDLLGFVDASTNFDKWVTWIELTVRQITNFTGKAAYNLANTHYNSNVYKTSPQTETEEENKSRILKDELVRKFQLTNALFAYVRLLPSLDAGHSNGGRKKTIGETERGLSAVEAYKDEINIQNLGYEALEDLLEYLEANKVEEWIESDKRKSTMSLLVSDLAAFNNYFRIDSVRLYYTLVPMIREIQNLKVKSVLGSEKLEAILTAQKKQTREQADKDLVVWAEQYVLRPLVLSTMALALRRLPVELLPEGIVQTQIVGTLKEKLIANENTRKELINNLDRDADMGFTELQEQVAVLDGAAVSERYVDGPKAKDEIKGFGF